MANRTKDVGGWLLLFCVITSILTPVAILASTVRSFLTPSWYVLFSIAMAGFSGIVGANVWIVSESAFKLLKVYFILLLGQGCLLVAAAVFVWYSGEELPSGSIIAGLRLVLFVIIWWAYFNMSKRVKETFGANL
jgi:hypothetical protein